MNKAQQGKKYKDVSFLYMTKGERKKNKTVIHEFIYLYVLVCEFLWVRILSFCQILQEAAVSRVVKNYDFTPKT